MQTDTSDTFLQSMLRGEAVDIQYFIDVKALRRQILAVPNWQKSPGLVALEKACPLDVNKYQQEWLEKRCPCTTPPVEHTRLWHKYNKVKSSINEVAAKPQGLEVAVVCPTCEQAVKAKRLVDRRNQLYIEGHKMGARRFMDKWCPGSWKYITDVVREEKVA